MPKVLEIWKQAGAASVSIPESFKGSLKVLQADALLFPPPLPIRVLLTRLDPTLRVSGEVADSAALCTAIQWHMLQSCRKMSKKSVEEALPLREWDMYEPSCWG